ncbi:Signal transduction histidine kinase [Oceanobacillus limi]|uniref:histidine kinase n=1 Tax=Oceanobacillus limi TaxID=930131 RepID=A0A1I0FFX4_9BACI|nr:sensor histidine kinase [Oceanobacillus limi]SET56826.1 Signal transduction histidine kinase [Oceanobacillus limi]
MRFSYWIWFFIYVIAWVFSMAYFDKPFSEMTLRLLGVALYFIGFFILPLLVRRPVTFSIVQILNALIAVFTLYPEPDSSFNPYIILIHSLLIAEVVYRLSFIPSMITTASISCMLLLTIFTMDILPAIQIFLLIYLLFFIMAMVFYKKMKDRTDDLDARYQALLSEYRNLKRRVVSEEDITRQEERMLIAHEIHDSVGHKLTALLMQLEMFRLNTTEEHKDEVENLKELANQSLEETRSAVKSLKTNDSGGLQGILRLIRKLEMESILRIHFSVKHGAFTAPLNGEQSFIIYRSVQEALTNIMKHSNAREVEILFEAPGGSIFRFEVSNSISNTNRFQEGFGLGAMRKRLEQHGGDLEIYKTKDQFIVSGYLKIMDRGE